MPDTIQTNPQYHLPAQAETDRKTVESAPVHVQNSPAIGLFHRQSLVYRCLLISQCERMPLNTRQAACTVCLPAQQQR